MSVSHAPRVFFRNRSYALAVVFTLAVALAATTAVVAVTSAVLLRPLPYPRPERLYRLNASLDPRSSQTFALSPIEVARLQQQARTLEQVEAMTPSEMALNAGGTPETLKVGMASAGFLRLLGLQPVVGRDFTAEEDSARLPVAVLDGGTWRRRFGSDPNVVGQSLQLDGTAYLVVGVTAEGVRPLLQHMDVWIPLGARDDPARQFLRAMSTVARLAPNRSLSEAAAEVQSIERRIAEDYPRSHANVALNVIDLRDDLYGSYRRSVVILIAAVLSLLLMACTNIANLTLSRVLDRRGEFALRRSLGASRGSILREQLAETTLLCVAGGAVGLVLAWWALPALLAVYGAALPADADVRVDGRVAAMMAVVVAVSALVAGLVPAYRAGTSSAGVIMSDASPRSVGSLHGRRTRQWLIGVQVALSVVLLGLATVVLSSLQRLNRTDPGLDATGVLTLQLAAPARYPDPQSRAAFLERVLARVAPLPGVVAAASTQSTFEPNATMTTRADVERAASDPGEPVQVNIRHVSPGFADALHVPLIEGRVIDARDRTGGEMVAMVSQSFARRYWPGTTALGRRVRRVLSSGNGPWLTVTGVVGDVMDAGLGVDIGPTLYVPYFQQNTPTARISLAIRTTSEPLALTNMVRQAIWAVDPAQPVDMARTLEDALSDSVAQPRLRALLIGAFGGFGLALACLGVYSVAAYGARQRAREIGVRLALGARRSDVTRFLVRRALPPVLGGALTGLAGAGVLVLRVRSLLYRPDAADAVYVFAACAVLVLSAVAAVFVPSGRAARVSPVEALRA